MHLSRTGQGVVGRFFQAADLAVRTRFGAPLLPWRWCSGPGHSVSACFLAVAALVGVIYESVEEGLV